MTARYLVGDVFDGLGTLDDRSVDLVLTSPPFLALRSYLPAGHPDKGREIGSERTPADYLDAMLDVVEACARVLAPHGSLVFELGDTYASSGGISDNRSESLGGNDFAPRGTRGHGVGWPLDKSLCMIPALFAGSLAYGRNLLRPERTTDPWRVRNVVAWCRPNPPVGALGDKYRPGTSYLTVACKAKDRWFDLDAIRVPYSENSHPRMPQGVEQLDGKGKSAQRDGRWSTLPERDNDGAGAPPLDWWEIPTEPYAGAHYATFPERLVVRPILSMCPERVCTVCGLPSRRIETVGWSDCGHNSWRRGIVCDPFAGSGTTLAVAEGHGRDSIGIDLDARNAELARERVGLWLTVS